MPEKFITNLIKRADARRKWREDRRTAEKVLSKRQQRYASDRNYRKRIKASVKRRREARAPSDRKRSFNRDKVIVINGVSVCLYSSGKAAHLIGVSAWTLKSWETKGLIPKNRAKDPIGRYWYPAEFVSWLADQSAVRPKGSLHRWSTQVKEAWQQLQLGDHPIQIVGDHLEENK